MTGDSSEPATQAQAPAASVPSCKSTQFATSSSIPSSAEGTRSKILDIRRDREEHSLINDIYNGLRPANGGEKRLPTLLLYDEKGLKLFERITYLEEYYLTNAEIEVLERHADAIAKRLQPGSIVLELGSGNLRKVNILLKAIDRLGKPVDYYALDLSLVELERTLAAIPENAYKHVKCYGLHGTYDDGLEWLKTPKLKGTRKAVLSLGSSIGNFPRKDAADFLKSFQEGLQPGDSMLIGIDACKEPERVYHAYNDCEGITHQFVLNGLAHANEIMGQKAFDMSVWKVIGEFDVENGRHHAFVTPTEGVTIGDVSIPAGERVRIEESYKFSADETAELWRLSGLTKVEAWSIQRGDYSLHMISKNMNACPTNPLEYAANPAPTFAEWEELWKFWDAVTRQMIPKEELLSKPIKLRNACIFYLGHIPTFLDMKLADTTDGKYSEPTYYPKIFERGIDPDVENPELCHAHSEIPDEYPPLDEILAHQQHVRERVQKLYDNGAASDPSVARTLWLGYEHEAMHLETLLYMLIQSEKTLSPPGTLKPAFEELAKKAKMEAVANDWCTVPESTVAIGMNYPENASGPARFFGWDIEKPERKVHVKSFQAKARPITIGDYTQYLEQTGNTRLPASWTDTGYANGYSNGTTIAHDNGHDNISDNGLLKGKGVKTVHGSIPLNLAFDWPVCASYDELAGCANWMGGRIPTLEEARSIYNDVDQSRRATGADKALGKTIPAVNGHLVNDGVEESPPSKNNLPNGSGSAKPDPYDTFIDLDRANVGFKNWHPMPVTQNGARLSGQADMGGVWEWTSTPLSPANGYEPMPLYPAYSSDFFDGKHNVVLGGSWATVPRIAGRKTFVNWYQRNYPYVWAGARVVRDL